MMRLVLLHMCSGVDSKAYTQIISLWGEEQGTLTGAFNNVAENGIEFYKLQLCDGHENFP